MKVANVFIAFTLKVEISVMKTKPLFSVNVSKKNAELKWYYMTILNTKISVKKFSMGTWRNKH